MKVLASDTWAGQIEGHPAEINFVVYADQVAEGRGEVDVSLCQAGRTEAPQLLIGTFQLFLRDFDTPWLQRFWSLYQHNSAFRREVDAFYCLAAYQTPVIQQSISLPRAEATITVDSPLANAIWALNAQGFETLASSAGGAYRKAFVTARHLPRELEEVAQAAGFAVANGTLSTDVPFCQPLAAEAASQSLVQMLHDWSQGE
ncbi:hypothetical protein BIS06_02460, partial [Halomonas sp. BBD48]|nr:hypothetical protein [Halomonas sp. BBD48]